MIQERGTEMNDHLNPRENHLVLKAQERVTEREVKNIQIKRRDLDIRVNQYHNHQRKQADEKERGVRREVAELYHRSLLKEKDEEPDQEVTLQ